MKTLSLATLADVPAAVATPRYDPGKLGIGIVHLGIGAFHRAHQAVFTDEAIALDGGDWGICGVSLRSSDVRDRLAPQDGLYTSIEKSPEGVRRRVIGSVREVLFLGDQRPELNARMIAAATRIVSLTITEKGYCHDPATGALNLAHPDIVHDLANPDRSMSAIGLMVNALAQRKRSHGRAFTVLCCDNLPHNGVLVRGLLVAFANAFDADLARWIDQNARFPSTMVDRIVPATTDADITDNDAALGMRDSAPVVHEPFKQWAIEDDFAEGRPAWEKVGAQLVGDVAPFETMKLRLLNASHSAFAYLGFLAGYEFIYQVAAQPDFVAFMRRLMQRELAPTLQVPEGVILANYQEALIKRFANPALPHRTQQIAMDGSQKLPQRMLAAVREDLQAGRPTELLALAVAGWMRYVGGVDEAGRVIKVSDPLAAEFASITAQHQGDTGAIARGLLGVRAVFGGDLPGNAAFVDAVSRSLASLHAEGAARTVRRAVSDG